MHKLFRATFLAFAAALAFAAPAYAKDYSLGEVTVDVTIDPDRSFAVTESRLYEFTGAFSWADLWIPTQIVRDGYSYNITIADFSVRDEDGTLLRVDASQSGGRFYAKWFHSAQDETKVFTWSYRVIGEGVKKYEDTGEFYWQVIGDEWKKSCGPVTVTVNLPPGATKEEVKVFGHGPLSGQAEIVDGQTTRFTVPELPPETFVEVRTLFPPRLLTGPAASDASLEAILAEEESFRQETLAKQQRNQTIVVALLIYLVGFIPLTVLGWAIWYYKAWKAKGKEYAFTDIPKYVRELPSDLPPAIVASLLRQGGMPDTRSFVATIFDLARQGFIQIDDKIDFKSGLLRTRKEITTTLRADYEKDRGGLSEHQRAVFDYIFLQVGKMGEGIRLDELKDYIRSHPTTFRPWFGRWQKLVQQEAKALGFLEQEGVALTRKFWIVSGALVLLGSPVLLLGVFLIPKLKRWKKRWAREAAEWKALRQFLGDFSRFEEIPPEAYKLWEHYLVFGVLFGNAEGILKSLPIILEDHRAVPAAWYYGGSAGRTPASFSAMSRSLSNFNSSFVAAASSSISTGSGGGFSGGGGGAVAVAVAVAAVAAPVSCYFLG